MKISILLPTRGRPVEFDRMAQSAFETANVTDLLEIVSYRDSDDPSVYSPVPHHKEIRGDRIVLSEMWNLCQKAATGEIFMHAGDDIVFRTKGWDTMVRSTFEQVPDKIVFVHGHDGANGEGFGTHGFIHKNWVDVVGYFVPPYFSSDYNDTWLNDVANGLNRRIFLAFVTEHMHFVFGKGPKDQTHLDRLERGAKDNVAALYEAKKPQRLTDIAMLKKFINNYQK